MYSPAISRDQYQSLTAESRSVADRLLRRQGELEAMERRLFEEAQRLREQARLAAAREADIEVKEVQLKEMEAVLQARLDAVDEMFMDLNHDNYWK